MDKNANYSIYLIYFDLIKLKVQESCSSVSREIYHNIHFGFEMHRKLLWLFKSRFNETYKKMSCM
jgi:hypothetical protein